MSDPVAIGDILDGLGVDAVIEEGELVEGAVVLLKVLHANGTVQLTVSTSDGLSWLEVLGMCDYAHALQVDTCGYSNLADDDD